MYVVGNIRDHLIKKKKSKKITLNQLFIGNKNKNKKKKKK